MPLTPEERSAYDETLRQIGSSRAQTTTPSESNSTQENEIDARNPRNVRVGALHS
jgi:hypothetical protein